MALADRGVQRVEVDVVHGRRQALERVGGGQLLHGQPLAAQGLDELVAPGLDGVLAPLPAEPLPDLVAGPGRGHDLQPVAATARPTGTLEVKISTVSADCSGVSRGTRRPLTLAPMQRWPDLGVDGVGEVDGGRARGEGDDLALGGEDVDLVLLEVELQRLEELERVDGLLLPVDDALQPRHLRRGRGGGVLDCSL